AERAGTEISSLRPGSLRAIPVVERVLSLERCGQLELLRDDGRNRVCQRQRQRLMPTGIQKRDLFVLAIEISLQRCHSGSDVRSWKPLFSPSRSCIESGRMAPSRTKYPELGRLHRTIYHCFASSAAADAYAGTRLPLPSLLREAPPHR